MTDDTDAPNGRSEDVTTLSDEALLEAIGTQYREALDEDNRHSQKQAFNRFHDLRKEAADRGLRSEASDVTERVRGGRDE